MSEVAGWIRDLGQPGDNVGVMTATGPDEGKIAFIPRRDAEKRVKAGTHVSVEGKDMATFDLAAERERQRPRNRAMRTDHPGASSAIPEGERQEQGAPAGDPPKPPEPPAAEAADGGERPRNRRVGGYNNRALTTKPGKED